MSLFLAIHVEGHRREDGVQGQVHPSEEDVHVLVLDPHVRAPEREAAEAARGDPDLLQDLRLGLVGDLGRRLRRLLDVFRLLRPLAEAVRWGSDLLLDRLLGGALVFDAFYAALGLGLVSSLLESQRVSWPLASFSLVVEQTHLSIGSARSIASRLRLGLVA